MQKVFRIFIRIWLILLAAIVCLPVLLALSGAFMQQWELQEYLAPVLGGTGEMAGWPLLPKAPTLQPLVELLIDSPQFFAMFWNSMKISLCIVAGQILFGTPAAWALAKFQFTGKKVVLMLYIVLMLMPFQVMMLPQYLVLQKIGVLDCQAAVILPGVFSTFPVFIMYRFFEGIPDALLEAARLDGAGELRLFFKIGLPLGNPGVISAMVLGFLEYWNMIEQPMAFLKTKERWPLSLYLPNIDMEKAGAAFAASVVVLIPAVLVFLAGQDYLEQGIIASALKE